MNIERVVLSLFVFAATSSYENLNGEYHGLSAAEQLSSADLKLYVSFWAPYYSIPVPLALALIQVESDFRTWPVPVSEKGAIGAAQILPATAKRYGCDSSRLHVPRENIHCGLRIFSALLREFEDPAQSLAAYYGGQRYWVNPSEEKVQKIIAYVSKVLRVARGYEALLKGHGDANYSESSSAR